MTRLASILSVVVMLVLGLCLGLAITLKSLLSTSAPGSVSHASWVLWPKAGAPDPDPYSKAIHARRGDIPMAQGEGLALFAFKDAQRRPLSGNCRYEVSGVFPTARVWTIAAYHVDGRLIDNPAARHGITSAEAVLESGQTRIQIAAAAQPGNWLPVEKSSPFVLVLRFYETPLSAVASVLDWSRMPRLSVLDCPS
ncbi:MAG: DUF1214 domain-containing protein [Beijerinckiaceae bacterium]